MPQTIPKMPQVNIFSCKGKNMIHYIIAIVPENFLNIQDKIFRYSTSILMEIWIKLLLSKY